MERGNSPFDGENKKFVFTDISDIAEAKAQDTSLSRFNEKPESGIPSGWKAVFSGKFWKSVGRSIWKQNLARDFLEVKYKKEAEDTIIKSGSLFATEQKFDEKEKGLSEEEKQSRKKQRQQADESYYQAITSRFAAAEGELVDDLIHSEVGEKIDKLGDGEAERNIKSQLQEVVKAFAGGKIDEERLLSEERAIFVAIKGAKPEIIDKGKVYASNLLRMAKWAKEEVSRQVAQNIEHNQAVMNLNLDFDVVVGKAKGAVRTEAQFNVVERAVDNIQAKTKGLFGFAFNETFVTSVVSAAYFVKRSLFTRGLSTAAGLGGVVAGVGAMAAFREGKTLEKERMQHSREMAQGRKFDESSATRRNELEKFRLKFRTAKDLETDLSAKLFNKLDGREAKDLSEAEYAEALKSVAEIDSRILESERGIVVRQKKWWQFWRKKEERRRADLIGYSDPTKEAEEEGQLDIARVKAKLELKKWALAHGKTPEQFKADLKAVVEGNIAGFYEGDEGATKLNEQFSKFKHQKMWQSAKRAMKWGAVIGVAIQEISALGDDRAYGALEHGWNALHHQQHLMASGEHATLIDSGIQHGIHYAKEGWEHLFPTVHAASGTQEFFLNSAKYHLGGDYNLVADSTTADPNDYILVDKAGHNLSEGLHFNTDGTPTTETTQWLKDHGFQVNEHLGTTTSDGIHNLDATQTHKVYPDLATNPRVDWHDEPGKFWSEIHKQALEFEGKQQMGFLEKIDGKVYLNCSKVINNFEKEIWERINDPHFGQVEGYTNPDGTPFVDPKMMHLKQQIIDALAKDELSKHFQAAVIPTEGANQVGLSDLLQGADSHGRILLEGKYDWSSMFTDEKMLHDGHLPFKFLEMRFDGHVMATAQGAGEVVHTAPFVEILPPSGDLPPTVFPPLFYAGRRKGLENTEWSPAVYPPPPPPSRYAGYYSSPERIDFYRHRLSPALQNNPEANLDFERELNWYMAEVIRNNPQYAEQLRELLSQSDMRVPMTDECRAVACIPVYDLGEGRSIEQTLDQYRKQIDNGSIRPEEFELLLFLNHPKDKLDAINIRPGAEQRVANGNPAIYDTEEVIRQYKVNYPKLKIRIIKKEFQTREKWGTIIKYLYDAACIRSRSRSNPVDKDIILLTNDADVRDMSDQYLRLIINEFDNNLPGSRKLDALATRLDYDPNVYKKWPTFFLANRFMQFLEAQTRSGNDGSGSNIITTDLNGYVFRGGDKKEKYINTWGASTALRGSIYCGIGGVDNTTDAGADSELGRMIINARRVGRGIIDSSKFPIKFKNSAWLESDPRRQLGIYKKGKPLVETWSEWGEMNVYGQTLSEQISGDSEVLDPIRLSKEINTMRKAWWGLTADSPIVKRALSWLGLKETDYAIENGEIKILNTDNLKQRLIQWKPKRERVEDATQKRHYSNFEANPFEFVFGNGLDTIKGSKFGIKNFMESLKTKYGISDAEFAQIEERTGRMPNMTGASRPQKELAQLLRVVMNKNPNLRVDWRSSGEAGSYERLVRRLVTAEMKGRLDNRSLTNQEVERLSREFGIHPAVVMDEALAWKPALKQEAARRFREAGGTRGDAEIERLADAQREVLAEYQNGRLNVPVSRPRARRPRPARTT